MITNSAATAYSNQKKLVTLSTGRMVMVIANTATNAMFKWSDDGSNWADYASDISGWANGSIASYVDAGGTERLVVAWKQTGTGGGRTSGRAYVMTGGFGVNRASLTWASAIEIGTDSGGIDYCDIVAIAHGTGGRIAISTSYASTNHHAYVYMMDVSSAGILSNTTYQHMHDVIAPSGYANGARLYPTIAMADDGRLHVAWSTGTTGVGQGIRYRTASYANGVWTWASEVAVDENLYMYNDPNQWGLVGKCNSGRYVVYCAGRTSAPANEHKMWETTDYTSFAQVPWSSATGTTGHLQSGTYGPSLYVDANGDIYRLGSNYIGSAGYAQPFYQKYDRATTTWQPYVATDQVLTVNTSTTHFINASPIKGGFGWIYTAGNNSPYAVKYDQLVINMPPVVTLGGPTDNLSVNLNTTAQVFTWSISDAEGDTQAKYVFRRRKPDHVTYEYWTGAAWSATLTEIISTTASATITANTWAGSKDWYWSVGVRDSSGVSSIGYSSEHKITNTAATSTVNTYVGSFAKQNTVGNQDITIPTDLTAAPAGSWAVIFWASPGAATSGTWSADIASSTGFAADGGGAVTQYVASVLSRDSLATSRAHRRMAPACISLGFHDGSNQLHDEAAFVGFQTSTTMRINWTTQAAGWLNKQISYMIITGLTGAKVVNWTTPTAAGTKSVAGIGFTPDVVLQVATGQIGALPLNGAHSLFGIGGFNKHGQQWSNSIISINAVSPSNTSRWQQTDSCLLLVQENEAAGYAQAHFTSMDVDGFTLNFSTAISNSPYNVVSLCLQGISSKIGAFTKSDNVASTTVASRHNFTVKGSMFTSVERTPASSPGADGAWTLGATDGTNQRVAGLRDEDAANPTAADSIWHSDKIITVPDAGPSTPNTASWTSSTTADFTVTFANSVGSNGMEFLYILLGDPGTDSSPTTIGFTSSTTATAYSNQRKMANLSTGRLVAVYGDTSSNAKFEYSDDGVTWVDMASDISGWSNGSIYVSSDDYIFAEWKQSGTAGGRTDLYSYLAMGTFNAAKTSITWSSAYRFIGPYPEYDYVDIVAHPEDGLWRVHAVASYVTGTTNVVEYFPVRFYPDGTSSRGSSVTLGGSYGVAVHTLPSIELNPLTKDLYVAWSAGTTGAGKGVRFKKAAYAGGTWAWGTEREIDTTRYLIDGDLRWCPVRFDQTNQLVMFGGMLFDGGNRDMVLYQRDAADTTTTTYVLTDNAGEATNDAIYSGTLVVDNAGNVYLVGTTGTRVTGYKKWTRTSATSGTLGSLVITEAAIPSTFNYMSGLFTNGRINWIYTKGNNSPYAVKYDYLGLNATPVVTLITPENGGRIDLQNNSQQFSWNFTDAENNAQTHYIFRRRRDGHNTYEYWNAGTTSWSTSSVENTSAVTTVTIPGGKFTAGRVYYWSIGVKDSTGSIGWSSERKLTNTSATVAAFVGSFDKQAAAGNQDVTIPVDLTGADSGSWAIIFWGNQFNGGVPVSGTWAAHIFQSVGFVANGGGSISQYAVGMTSVDAQATTITSRRTAAACITVNDSADAAYAEASFVSFPTATTMRLSWSLNGGSNRGMINYMIITGLSGAKVVNWTTPASAIDQSVTGVGFRPDVVLHTSSGGVTLGTEAYCYFGWGVMNKYGQQWANAFASEDALNPSNTSRFQQTDACLVRVSGGEVNQTELHYKSMDADGFTVSASTVPGSTRQVISLCIKGASSRLGAFRASTTSGVQDITTRHGFAVRGALFSTFGQAPGSAPAANSTWGLGASDGTNERVAYITDIDAVTPTQTDSVWVSGKALHIHAGSATTGATASVAFGTDTITATWTAAHIAHEYLYMLLGDAEADTIPATIGTTTSSTATAYSNQKKLVRLSTGRLVAVYGDTGTNAKFKYSDDGVTWADMQSDIAGWANGSIYADEDDHIHVAWKQSGTGGGRTDEALYYMRGVINATKTAISWSAHQLIDTEGASNYNNNNPDLVAFREGTGWVAHIVWSLANPAPNLSTYYNRFTTSSSGVITHTVTSTVIGPNYGVNTGNPATGSTFPSIDYNPSTKDLYAAWFAGAGGAGKGIRFKKATYAGGAWTWGTEREITTDLAVAGGTDAYRWTACRFDGTRVLIGGLRLTTGGSGDRLFLFERDAADTTTTQRLFALVDSADDKEALYNGSMTYDQDGNVYFGGGSWNLVYTNLLQWKRGSATLSSLTNTDLNLNQTYLSFAPGHYDGKIEWVYTSGNNSPYAVKYDYIKATGEEDDNLTNKWGTIPI